MVGGMDSSGTAGKGNSEVDYSNLFEIGTFELRCPGYYGTTENFKILIVVQIVLERHSSNKQKQ